MYTQPSIRVCGAVLSLSYACCILSFTNGRLPTLHARQVCWFYVAEEEGGTALPDDGAGECSLISPGRSCQLVPGNPTLHSSAETRLCHAKLRASRSGGPTSVPSNRIPRECDIIRRICRARSIAACILARIRRQGNQVDLRNHDAK